jgi:predicted SprT family Zn-dependent metalloprotease
MSSCPGIEREIEEALAKLSSFFKSEKPPYRMDAEKVCRIGDKRFPACVTYYEEPQLHFSCSTPKEKINHLVAHEYAHWLFYKRGGDYTNEMLVETFARAISPQIRMMKK